MHIKPRILDKDSYFDRIEMMVVGLEDGTWKTATVPDSPQQNTGQIASPYGIGLEEGERECFRLSGIAGVMTSLLHKQLAPGQYWQSIRHHAPSMRLDALMDIFNSMDVPEAEEDVQMGKNFECALTRYEGKASVYIVLPEGKTINFDQLKKDFAEVKSLCKEVAPPKSAGISQIKQSSECWFGPFNAYQAQRFKEVLPSMNHFHRLEGIHGKAHPVGGGMQYLIFDRRDIGHILKKERLSLDRTQYLG